MNKKVLVSGCFDMLHSGHIAFLESAAAYGELHVGLGSDQTLFNLKGRPPVNDERERLFMIQAINCVKGAFISQGSGILDFSAEIETLQPDLFVVNQDGNVPEKQRFCQQLGIKYIVLSRKPHDNLHMRSTTSLREIDQMPYRIDLAGGWSDQPFVSKHHPGAVVTLSIEPTIEFNERSGMATSTRRKAIEIWGNKLPLDNPEKIAKVLFCCDNPPGSPYISGSQDSIGIVYSGLARSYYEGDYWPATIEHHFDGACLDFVESALYLKPLSPRGATYDVLSDTRIDEAKAGELAEAADWCWRSVLAKDLKGLGGAMRRSFEAQIAMFPHMANPDIMELIEHHRDQVLGWKLAGAGGGGYLVMAAEQPIPDTVQILARRPQG
jgi:cytidyltransferase-like protein